MYLLLSVTDLELTAAQAVKFILVAILIGVSIVHLIKMRRSRTVKQKFWKATLATLFIGLTVPVFKWIIIDGSLLNTSEYTVGTTLGICHVLARGRGVKFEYEVNAQKYTGCNSYHPIPIDNITTMDGKYYVRYSDQFPANGRIDFRKRAE